ncbi:MAG: thioredoxin domain-containing protein [Deltaproteobacteria bacterium]|nr:thioredoxin domain-containing protein [Deltaproteobacteria bacterium]
MKDAVLRTRQGAREAELTTSRLRAAVEAGQLAEDVEVWDDAAGAWLSARRWYLLNTRIVAAPDTDDDRYLAAHTAGALDLHSLVGFLGVSLADAEGRLHVEDAAFGQAIDMRVSEAPLTVDFGHDAGDARDRAIATVRDGRADERIEVPSWGRPWGLPQSAAIPIPEWQDPATARIELPPWEPPVWAAMPEPKRGEAPRPPVGPETARTKEDAARDRVDKAERLAKLRAAQARRQAAAEADALRAELEAEAAALQARNAEELAQARAAVAAAAPSVDDPPAPAEASQASAPNAGPKPDAVRSGCLGCFGRLIGLGVLAMAALIASQIALERFLASPVAGEVASAAPQAHVRHVPRALQGLLQIGPAESALPVVVAFDPATPEGVRTLRAALQWVGRSEHGRLRGARAPRLVLLPLGGPGSTPVAALFALDALGELLPGGQSRNLLDAVVAKGHPLDGEVIAELLGKAGLDAPDLERALALPSVVERAQLAARVAAAFDLAAPAGIAVAARPLPASALGSERALRIALDSAARVAAAQFANGTPETAWRRVLAAAEPARAERWLAWIVRGERLGKAPDAATAAAASGPVRLPVPQSAPRIGSTSGVQLVLVADLHCPYSARLWRGLRQAIREREDDFELVFIHYPIANLHPKASEAAQLAQALWLQSPGERYWRAIDWQFRHPNKVDAGELLRRARLGRTAAEAAALQARASTLAISGVLTEHREWAREYGVRGTPVLFVDGHEHKGARSRKSVEAILQAALAARAAATAAPLSGGSTPDAP